VLLVGPTSVLTNWKREAAAFTQELVVNEDYGPRRPNSPEAIKKALKGVDLVLTTYGLLQRDSELLEAIDWQGVVIDEAQAIKNHNAKQSMAARDLGRPGRGGKGGSRFRIALTGTPVENRVSELWALMDFLNPKVLGDEPVFRQRYRLPIERYGDMSSLRDLKGRVGPFIPVYGESQMPSGTVVQQAGESARAVSIYLTNTAIRAFENWVTFDDTLPAISRRYRVFLFETLFAPSGNESIRIEPNVFQAGFGKLSTAYRYVRESPSPDVFVTAGKTADVQSGGLKVVLPDGSVALQSSTYTGSFAGSAGRGVRI
jgi:hypothetical protein